MLKDWGSALSNVVANAGLPATRMNGESLTPERWIELWLYGEHFHWDEDKAETLGAWPPDVSRWMLINVLWELARRYWAIRNVVCKVLRHSSLTGAPGG